MNAIPFSATSLSNLIFISIEDGTEVVLRSSSNMIGDSDDQINFLHELLLTIRKVSNLRKVFADKSSTDIKLSKTQTYRSYNLDDFLLDFLVHY